MFRTSFINLLFYPHLLSISFVMSVSVANTYRSHVMIKLYENLITFSSLILLYSSMLSLYSSCHTPMIFTINLNLLWCDCFCHF
jgi:hypothetical protein